MKRFIAISALTAITAFHCVAANSRELVIAVSPHQETTAARQQATEVFKFLTTLEPGDTATLIDGYNLMLIGEWKTPTKSAYRSPKARLAVNRQAVAALLHFADNAAKPGVEDQPSVTGALRLPQLLRHVAGNFPVSVRRELVILGSPLYEDRDTPALSMTEERFPGDGHLFASIRKTPYGAAGNPKLLAGLAVHIGYGAAGLPGSERHDEFVRRYWTLFVEAQGGELVSFVGDLPTLFSRMKVGTPALKHDYAPERSNKLEMIRLAPVEVQKSIYDRPIEGTPLSKSQSRRAERVEVGITWHCDSCDLDLYAQAHPGAALLYFSQTTSPEGRYWKDYRNSPKGTNGRESILFTVPLDLRVLRLAVNFYAGQAPQGVEGEIRLAVDGQTYATAFHISANEGNAGVDMRQIMATGKADTPYSILIDPLRVVGLR
ncbi:MAG: hypothetical protein AB2551_10975 [Candidatus Thiodiazotropha sp.]